MIYTVTLNPSIDYMVSVPDFKINRTNRTEAEYILPGGKGINVSTVLHNLGWESVALGFVAGFTGDEIVRRVADKGISNGFIRLEEGMSRINVKMTSADGTEINGMGPVIPKEKAQELMRQLDSLGEGDVLFLSGSVPVSMSSDIYKQIMEQLEGRGVCIVVDAAKELLSKVLPYKPFLIKPNHHELGELFGVELHARDEVGSYAHKLQEAGARNVLVSMAGEGAVLLTENGEVYSAPAPMGQVVNSVGAGDSMVAGFMAGWLEQKDYRHGFYMGLAAGSASAFGEQLATKEEIMALYEQIV